MSPTKTQQVGTTEWNAVAYGNGRYVAVGYDGYITESTDGINWATPQKVGADTWECITYGNGKFVIGSWDGKLSCSTNGKNWTSPIESGNASNIADIIYANGKFVALGTLNATGYIITSTDGVNWNEKSIGYGYYWRSLSYGSGKYVVVGEQFSSIERGYIITSNDGMNWDKPIQVSTQEWSTIAYGNGRFVTIGSSGSVTTSTDGENWSGSSLQYGTWSAITVITYENGRFIAVGKEGQGFDTVGYIITSTDGISWTKFMALNGIGLNGVCAML